MTALTYPTPNTQRLQASVLLWIVGLMIGGSISVPAVAHPHLVVPSSYTAKVNEVFGLTGHNLFALSVPSAPASDGSLTISVVLGTETVQLKVFPHSVRAKDYQLIRQTPERELVAVLPGEERTWRGKLTSGSGVIVDSFVAGSLTSDGRLYGWIARKVGADWENWWVESLFGPFSTTNLPSGITAATHVVYRGSSVIRQSTDSPQLPQLNVPVVIDDLRRVSVAEIGLDVDAEFYRTYNRDPGTTESALNSNVRYSEEHAAMVLNLANVPFEQYVAIQHRLTGIVTWPIACRSPPTN